MAFKGKRFVVGKLGLDGHDNGLRIISKWLMDNGYEVIYAGLYNSTKRMVQIALEENADAVGISFLGGGHLFYADQLVKELRTNEMGDVKIVLGGVIPADDVRELKSMGVHTVFTPGTPKQTVLETIESLWGPK